MRWVPSGANPARTPAPSSHMLPRPATHIRQRPQEGRKDRTTWSPSARSCTSGPTSVTTPAPSCPPRTGAHGSGMSPVSRWSSLWQMPDEVSLTVTSRRFGGSSSISSTLQPECVPGSHSSAPTVFIDRLLRYWGAVARASGWEGRKHNSAQGYRVPAHVSHLLPSLTRRVVCDSPEPLEVRASLHLVCGAPHLRRHRSRPGTSGRRTMALDDATTALLTQLAESGTKPLHEMTPQEARGLTAALGEMYGPGPDMHRAEDATAPAPDGHPIPLRVLVPTPSPRGVLVYYHGGGWVIGALPEFETLGRTLAERTGCAVVLVDYRMAPEHPYPAAADDAWAALQWVGEHVEEIAGGPVPLLVGGDSAGGNLTAIVAQKARDAGGPALAMQLLAYPVTDCDLDNETYSDPANQLMLSRESMVWFWDLYAPEHALRQNPDACPSKAAYLSGLPPAVVLLAEHDVLRQEGQEYADALERAGVPVQSRVFDGQMHGFFTMVNVLPGSAAGIAWATDAIDHQLTAQPA